MNVVFFPVEQCLYKSENLESCITVYEFSQFLGHVHTFELHSLLGGGF